MKAKGTWFLSKEADQTLSHLTLEADRTLSHLTLEADRTLSHLTFTIKKILYDSCFEIILIVCSEVLYRCLMFQYLAYVCKMLCTLCF